MGAAESVRATDKGKGLKVRLRLRSRITLELINKVKVQVCDISPNNNKHVEGHCIRAAQE